jgi:glycosyltransferase involved in cell wall biosynthesis
LPDFRVSRRFQHQHPKVSVLVPTYNRASFLEGTLQSIFDQTVAVHEVIVIDDGSDDGTAATLSGISARHPDWHGRLKCLFQPNEGKSAALNRGLKHASGDWIAFDDSDDRWLREKLELQFAALAVFEEAEACFTDVRFVNNPDMRETALQFTFPPRTRPFGIARNVASLYGGAIWPGIYMQSVIVSRRAMEAVGQFDESFRMSMDTDFTFRLGLLGPMCYVDMPMVEVDRTFPRRVGLTTEYPLNGSDRLAVHERMITKWLEDTRRSNPRLARRLRYRRSATQSALANNLLLSNDVAGARAVLARSVRQCRRPQIAAKLLWALVSPRSLRRVIASRAAQWS